MSEKKLKPYIVSRYTVRIRTSTYVVHFLKIDCIVNNFAKAIIVCDWFVYIQSNQTNSLFLHYDWLIILISIKRYKYLKK